ncbi:TadE family type IV pilus minor pilin [Nocardioides sp. AX2bis]|uniref:TadE family type IV pilus minor pilin n=1 Tax=Nocardioides sp. AX2bis TaxID=2653157 RepID=UPI0012F15F49|nr:TadE family type IV pilus minor pilin [Nocardioides sp. AX2bis]VXC25334.1 conserved hypothetical protein [Nocardioides sp. AX2bis]
MRREQERGAVTAEAALVLPLLVAVTVALCWLLAVGAAQVRTVDAAREAARSAARGDDPGAVRDLALRVAPDGATVDVALGAEEVVVTVTGRVAGPGGLVSWLPGATVGSQAVARVEPGVAG